MPVALELSGVPDARALQAALNMLARRHEVLRMRYQSRPDGSVVGFVSAVADFSVPLTVVAVDSAAEETGKLRADAARPFSLETGPLIRALLLTRTYSSGATLALNLHHAVGDAWSWGVIYAELAECFIFALRGKSGQPALDALPIQYADYAAWQQEQLASRTGQQLRHAWEEMLAGAPPVLSLPLDHPRPTKPSFLAGSTKMQLPAGLMVDMDLLAEQLCVNTQAVLLAGLQVVLSRYSGQDDLVVGVPVAGRDRPETQGLVGYFINTLPVRCNLEDDPELSTMTQRASNALLFALSNSLLPLEQVLAAARVQRVAGANPLFQASFSALHCKGVPIATPFESAWAVFLFHPQITISLPAFL